MSFAINLYKKLFIHRYDDCGYIKYFCASDFDGLHHDEYSFMSGENLLKGNFYYYDGYVEDELVIFCHGIGGGHLSYMTEIELLCRKGYNVLAYDNTGCFESEGESINCISQSLADLDCAIRSLKARELFQSFKKVYVIGHSWGGFAAGNIANFYEIDKAVVISSFASVAQLLKNFSSGALGFFARPVINTIAAFEKAKQPRFFASSSIDAMNEGKTKYLIAHSTDDNMIPFKHGLQYVRENCKNGEVEYLVCNDRKHNPNYTKDAVDYMNGVLGKFNTQVKFGRYKTLEEKKKYFTDIDWYRMTKQDEEFWEKVICFLKK